MLKVGDRAPDIQVHTDTGEDFRLSDMKGKRVVLYFYPKADTPGCTVEACEFRDDCEAYHAGDADYASQIWYWTTPIEDCVDGRTDVKCVDYAAWTEAWSEIKG